MSLFVNGTEITSIICNGVELTEVWPNGVLVFEAAQDPFWIKPSQNTTVRFKTTYGTPSITKSLKYSTDMTNWTSISLADFISTGVSATANQKLYIASDDTVAFSTNSAAVGLDVDAGTFDVGGDAKWLFNKSGTLPQYGLQQFFYKNANISSAFELNIPDCGASCCYGMFRESALSTPMTSLPGVVADSCYREMFYNCTNLTTAPQLPQLSLANACYQTMFSYSGLVTPPALPATTLAPSCYYGMFHNCANLTSAPALPAMQIDNVSYRDMFKNCTALTAAPSLPATSVVSGALRPYTSMFMGCTALTTIPAVHIADIPLQGCQEMFRQCTSLKFSTTQTSDCPNAYRFPAEGTGSVGSNGLYRAFYQTSGTYTSNPSINTTYYTNATVV